MYILVTSIKDENGKLLDGWLAFETEAEVKSAYETAIKNPSLYSASYGKVVASTHHSVK